MAAGDRAHVKILFRDSSRKQMRASGFRVQDGLVLTADHCADGVEHKVWSPEGHAADAEVVWRSGTRDADLALLSVTGLPTGETVPLALIDRNVSDALACRSACYPAFKRPDGAGSKPSVTVATGTITPMENTSPDHAVAGTAPTLSFALSDVSVQPAAEQVGPHHAEAWKSASGGGVLAVHEGVTYCVGVITERDKREDVRSLHVAGFDTLLRLDPADQKRFWELMNISCHPGDAGDIIPNIDSIPRTNNAWALEKLKSLKMFQGLIRDDSYSNLEVHIVSRAIGLDGTKGVGV